LQAGGNLHQRIQMMQQEHEATMRNVAVAPAPAASPLATLRGLVGQVRRWLVLRGKRREIAAAERRAAERAAELAAERGALAGGSPTSTASGTRCLRDRSAPSCTIA